MQWQFYGERRRKKCLRGNTNKNPENSLTMHIIIIFMLAAALNINQLKMRMARIYEAIIKCDTKAKDEDKKSLCSAHKHTEHCGFSVE
jgi:hypothetical protein